MSAIGRSRKLPRAPTMGREDVENAERESARNRFGRVGERAWAAGHAAQQRREHEMNEAAQQADGPDARLIAGHRCGADVPKLRVHLAVHVPLRSSQRATARYHIILS